MRLILIFFISIFSIFANAQVFYKMDGRTQYNDPCKIQLHIGSEENDSISISNFKNGKTVSLKHPGSRKIKLFDTDKTFRVISRISENGLQVSYAKMKSGQRAIIASIPKGFGSRSLCVAYEDMSAEEFMNENYLYESQIKEDMFESSE